MRSVFIGALRVLARKPDLLVWALAFPLILSTLFMLMFSNLDEAESFEAVPTAVVADDNYDNAPAFAAVVERLGKDGEDQLLDVREYGSFSEACAALTADANDDAHVFGVLSVDDAGMPHLTVAATADTGTGVEQASRTILETVVDTYVRDAALVSNLARDNPTALADPLRVERALARENATETVSLTQAEPLQSVRYYYALLGMAALFCSQIGMTAVCEAQPNLHPLGARRAVGGVSRGKTLIAVFAASWIASFACLGTAFLFIRFVVGIDFCGREGLCVAGLGAAALFATAFGALVGSLPKLDRSAKGGLITGITCLLSLFAGLYGQPCMELADDIARNAPVLASVNPAKVITDLFYSLYYYDSLAPFSWKLLALLGMAAASLALSAVLVRRQRYASL